MHAFCIVTEDMLQDGDTPLLKAAANGHADIVRELLKAGANIRFKNKVRHHIFIHIYENTCMYLCM